MTNDQQLLKYAVPILGAIRPHSPPRNWSWNFAVFLRSVIGHWSLVIGYCSLFGRHWSFFVPLVTTLFCSTVTAHPVPRREYDRTIRVNLTPANITVEYRLEVDEWTVVFVELPKMIDRQVFETFRKPDQFRAAFVNHLAPLLADQLHASVGDQPLVFRCVRQQCDVIDHLRCFFVFEAEWPKRAPFAGQFQLEDLSFENVSGRLDLSLMAEPGVSIQSRRMPDLALKNRSARDRLPGDEKRLRTVSALVDVSGEAIVNPQSESPNDVGVTGPRHDLLALLDSPHGLGVMLVLAAVFGAAHALTPGHGKTMVAAYLVGENGTTLHAFVLGLVTTLTHTGAVLVLAFGLVFLFPEAVPAHVQTVLGFSGGLLIAGLGVWLLLKRLAGQADHVHVGGNDASTPIQNEGTSNWWQIVVLGMSGGMIPCWDAIAMLGFAIAAQRLWLGLPLLLAFSAGLAAVLVVLGIAVVHARGWLGGRWSELRIWRLLPIASALVLTVLGVLLCRDSLNLH